MRNVLKIVVALLALMFLFSCQKPYVTTNELAVSQETIELPSLAGGYCYISVFSNTNWTIAIEPAVNWAVLGQNSGSGTGYVKMVYQDNLSGTARSAEVVVRTSAKECRILVKQPEK